MPAKPSAFCPIRRRARKSRDNPALRQYSRTFEKLLAQREVGGNAARRQKADCVRMDADGRGQGRSVVAVHQHKRDCSRQRLRRPREGFAAHKVVRFLVDKRPVDFRKPCVHKPALDENRARDFLRFRQPAGAVVRVEDHAVRILVGKKKREIARRCLGFVPARIGTNRLGKQSACRIGFEFGCGFGECQITAAAGALLPGAGIALANHLHDRVERGLDGSSAFPHKGAARVRKLSDQTVGAGGAGLNQNRHHGFSARFGLTHANRIGKGRLHARGDKVPQTLFDLPAVAADDVTGFGDSEMQDAARAVGKGDQCPAGLRATVGTVFELRILRSFEFCRHLKKSAEQHLSENAGWFLQILKEAPAAAADLGKSLQAKEKFSGAVSIKSCERAFANISATILAICWLLSRVPSESHTGRCPIGLSGA